MTTRHIRHVVAAIMVVNPSMIGWRRSADTRFRGSDGSMPLERACHTATAVAKDIYVIGGRNKYVQRQISIPVSTVTLVCCHQCVACHSRQNSCEGVCKLDTVSEKWSTGFLQAPFGERKYHTANLVGSDIWVVGGCDQRDISSHTCVFDTHTLQWRAAKLR